MEYQAKELFAKHDVPVTLGNVVETAEEAKAAAEELGGVVVVKAQVKAGAAARPAASSSPRRPTRPFEHAANILGMEIKGLTVNRVLIAPADAAEEEYYFSFLLDRANRQYLCIASVEGGVEIEEVAKTNPDAVKQIAIDPGTGVDEAKAREIVAEAAFPEPRHRPGRRDGRRSCGRSSSRRTRRSSRSTRSPGWPATSSRRSTARSRSTRTPSSATRTTRSSRTGSGRPARGQGQGQGPQLRQARRCRRHHRQRRRAWSCRRSTSSRTPARRTAASSPPTSSTSAAARTRRSWPTAST